jgi:hypothetical protein
MNPIIHTENSMRKFGGKTPEDFEAFLVIHKKMDCSKAYFSDNRHRALTHHMFWVNEVMLPIFGDWLEISTGKKLSVKDICEQHILEDFRMKFIPTVQDYLQEMDITKWMQNGAGSPSSAKRLYPELEGGEEQEEEQTPDCPTKNIEEIIREKIKEEVSKIPVTPPLPITPPTKYPTYPDDYPWWSPGRLTIID